MPPKAFTFQLTLSFCDLFTYAPHFPRASELRPTSP